MFPRDVFDAAVSALDSALWIDLPDERHDVFLTRGREAENQLKEMVLVLTMARIVPAQRAADKAYAQSVAGVRRPRRAQARAGVRQRYGGIEPLVLRVTRPFPPLQARIVNLRDPYQRTLENVQVLVKQKAAIFRRFCRAL